MAKITFLGAAGTVTGSKYLVEAGGKRLLVDCGLFEGLKELRQRNWDKLPVDPATIDWVLLTHAHIDHTGYLPRLVRDGFRGPIYANPATHELCELLLPDSAHLQEEDAQFAAKKGYSSHKPPLPLYTIAESQTALARFQEVPRAQPFTISPAFSVQPHDAGHILGSTWLELTITENGKSFVVVFSGDVGRYDQPILKNPEAPTRADYLLCESTYGDRDHPGGSVEDALADAITRVAKRGGAVVIPAFAVGRTQTLMYLLRELEDQQRIPKLPIYVDSPMAISVTDLYMRHHEDHDLAFTREEQGGGDPLNAHEVHLTRAVEESKKINDVVAPCIIISASGMLTGGRILHHLARRLPDSRSAVLIVGYQAEATRGRQLLEGAKFLRIFGEQVPVRAEVVELNQLSAHAGQSELMRWLSGFAAAPRQTFMVHGEPPASQALKAMIEARWHWNVTLPAYEQSFDLVP
jgi:metallo-beta-lactamase family protein